MGQEEWKKLAEAVLAEWRKKDPLLSNVDSFLRSFNKTYRKIGKQLERDVKRLVRALTAPIIVYPGGWHDTIPRWMKTEVTLQRLVQLMKGREGSATDIEALIYLYTACFVAPFNESWTNIYMYLTKKCMEARGRSFPEDLGNPALTDHQKDLLDDLKRWLWKQTEKAFTRVK
jgi:hypothetical protein